MQTPSITSASLANPSGAENNTIRNQVPAVLSILEAAVVLTISKRKAADLIATGSLKSIRIGRRRVITRGAVEDFLGIKLA